MTGVPEADGVVAAALRHVAERADGPPPADDLRVTLHLHPDRRAGAGTVLEQLAVDGVYRSQFETGTSNGGLSARPGGQRWRWESRLFGGAYDAAPPRTRPVYGALNHRRRSEGGSVRFGSVHLRLAGHTLNRTTFCYPDSVFEPTAVGNGQHLALVALADADDAVGAHDRLDDYVEAQVHGPLVLATDVEAIVLDPAYRDTPVASVAATLPFPLEWHRGFRLHVTQLAQHADYRGADVVGLGRRLAHDGWLDAALIGSAAWVGTADEQTLKRLWHCVARWGGPGLPVSPTVAGPLGG